jgi:uncharacterized SAM-dependent methyltransferase
VDISPAALEGTERRLERAGFARVSSHVGPYEHGTTIMRALAGGSARILVLFLGSNIGNFDPPVAQQLLRAISDALRPGDGLLLGADLVKPEPELIEAYDDPLGVTAAFNRNLLARINRELAGTFELPAWRHRARWNAEESRVEMHLDAARAQRVHIGALDLDLTFQAGDSIWTESSYKYEPAEVSSTLQQAGFTPTQQWIDEPSRFCLTLAQRP